MDIIQMECLTGSSTVLYQVATGLLSADQIAGPLRSILSRQRNVEVLQDEVTGIDVANRLVHLTQHQLPYDFLILATGIQYNYFGHDEWRRVAPGLESLDDADLIREKFSPPLSAPKPSCSRSRRPSRSPALVNFRSGRRGHCGR